jgi:hypothetical protein
MSILTDRDLEYLANLQKGWRRLYLSEVARLLSEDHNARQAKERPAINTLERLRMELVLAGRCLRTGRSTRN